MLNFSTKINCFTYFRLVKSKKRILVSPLDWGIGHASRCVPLIKSLLLNKFEVIIAANGRSELLLKLEFPELKYVKIEGYNISYPKNGNMIWSIFLQIPKIIKGITQEHKTLKKIVSEYKIDGVISDNRFGLWNKGIPSVFITHQLNIQSKYFSNFIRTINFYFINKYNECWVPDFEDNRLSGDLSIRKSRKKNIKFIGALSRFLEKKLDKKYDLCFIISGPEPQRTILEKIAINELKKKKEKTVIILGKPEDGEIKTIRNCEVFPHLDSVKLNNILNQSEVIISRSGYSTIMDLYKIGKKAIFIPTPGQTEQEYLAKNLKEKGICYFQSQSEFNLKQAVTENTKYTGFNTIKREEQNWDELFMIFSE